MVKSNSQILDIAFVHRETFCEVKGPCICDRIPDTMFFMFTNITPHFDYFKIRIVVPWRDVKALPGESSVIDNIWAFKSLDMPIFLEKTFMSYS